MPECAIEIKLATKDTEKAFKLISVYREIAEIKSPEAEHVRSRLTDALGNRFAEIMFAELHSTEQILMHKRFLDNKVLDDLELFRALIAAKTTNKNRIWQDTWNEDVHPKEITPQNISFKTQRKIRKGYDWNFIEFYYDSNESYKLKAAVFCSAIEAAGFYVVEVSSNDEYEVDYEV